MADIIHSEAKLVSAPKSDVWKVISTFDRKTPGVKDVQVTSQKKTGKGAKRRITFEDGTVREEEVLDWSPSSTIRVRVRHKEGPVRAGEETIELESHDLGTLVVQRGHYEVGLMDKLFRAGRVKRAARQRMVDLEALEDAGAGKDPGKQAGSKARSTAKGTGSKAGKAGKTAGAKTTKTGKTTQTKGKKTRTTGKKSGKNSN